MNKLKTYKTADELPKGLKWSSDKEFPKVGEIITINFNDMGTAKVTGYFSEEGWAGVTAIPLEAPAWWIKQNGVPSEDNCCYLFGAEMKEYA